MPTRSNSGLLRIIAYENKIAIGLIEEQVLNARLDFVNFVINPTRSVSCLEVQYFDSVSVICAMA